jgi:hypothetical protein
MAYVTSAIPKRWNQGLDSFSVDHEKGWPAFRADQPASFLFVMLFSLAATL